MNNSRCYYVDIPVHPDTDGNLFVAEGNSKSVPFDIKRVFWIRDMSKNAVRGQHATKRTKIILVPVFGSCEVIINDGKSETVYRLNSPKKGLFIDKMLWRTITNFSDNCIVEALCDCKFEPNNETYNDFSEYLRELKTYEKC